MTISGGLAAAARKLKSVSDSPRLDAEVLLAHVLKTTRAGILARAKDTLSAADNEHFQTLLKARQGGYPVAYLTGYQEFRGLRLMVNEHVLIPRPTTELLIDEIEKHVQADESITLADIGTGSGAIAIAISLAFPQAQVIATDISPQALSIAHYNARHGHLTNRVTFAHGSLLEPFKKLPNPDVVIANLPYLAPGQMSEPSIQYEPRLALAGGKDGLLLVWRLLDQLSSVHPLRGIVLELDPTQVDPVQQYIGSIWPQYATSIISDGLDTRGLAAWIE